VLKQYPKVFERLPSPTHMPTRFRLSRYGRRACGVTWKSVNGMSQRAEHWLGLGDVWIALKFAGGRPVEWRTEPDAGFDVLFAWEGQRWLMEYQRTPITEKAWREKWRLRREWFGKQKWDVKPRVVLLDVTRQKRDTIQLPPGTIHVTDMNMLPRLLRMKPSVTSR